MIECKHIPPAPGCQRGPEPCLRNPESSSQFCPPSFDRNKAASSIPACTVSGSVNDGSRCQTRLNSHGCGVPSYHWCVPGTPSYTNLLPTGSHVLPPSLERWINCPNQPLDCDAYSRFGSTGDPLRWYISQPAKWGPLMSHFSRLPSDVRTNAPLRVPTSTRTLLMSVASLLPSALYEL